MGVWESFSMTASHGWLLVKALILRILMRIGMFLHCYPIPRPPRPSFTRTLARPAPSCWRPVKLLFYTPREYSSTLSQKDRQKYPVVVNFHGGGFCLGRASDDARWARTVVDTANAVVVSVAYRLAPEWPFPAAVDDGVDALLYLESHADELCLDVSRVALTGFSAGGNLAFTVPLRLHSRLQSVDLSSSCSNSSSSNDSSNIPLKPSSSVTPTADDPSFSPAHSSLRILSIVSWYPVLDFVIPRHVRRNRAAMPSKALPPFLTKLFDDAYLPRPTDGASPYASPLRAYDDALAAALPADIFIYMCEWDMLADEGKEFVHRLEGCVGLGREEGDNQKKKRVRSTMIEQCVHAWDKSANPFRDQGRIDVLYLAASEELRKTFEQAAADKGESK